MPDYRGGTGARIQPLDANSLHDCAIRVIRPRYLLALLLILTVGAKAFRCRYRSFGSFFPALA